MKFKAPDSLIIVSVILVLFAGLTWIVPAGEFDRTELNNRQVVVQGSYHEVDPAPQGMIDILKAPLAGFESAVEIIAFVLLVGGAFSLFTATGAFDAFFLKVLNAAKSAPALKSLTIAGLMLIFSFGGMTFGMSEETLVFILITLPLAASLGYDNIVGMAIPFVGAGVGFAGAAFNPFTVGIAQGIAEIPLFSGSGYRLTIWAVFTVIAIFFVLWYAKRIERKPELAFTSKMENKAVREVPLTPSRVIALLLFLGALVAIALGASKFGWYIPEICAIFITLGVVSAAINFKAHESYISAFYEG